MHIEVSGDGPDLVLLHGWAMHGEVFAPLVDQLRSHFTVHVVDLPGHGRSVEDSTPLRLPYVVNAIAAATPPAVWCGWSLGGLFAQHAAATVPKVRGLVMLASSPRFVRGQGWPEGADAAVLTQLGQALQDDFASTIERFLALDVMATPQARQQMQQLRQRLLALPPAPRVLQEGLKLLQDTDLRGALLGLPRPSLWMAGQRDRVVTPAAMQAAAALAPRAHALTIAQGGHAPFLARPEQVGQALQQFVATLA